MSDDHRTDGSQSLEDGAEAREDWETVATESPSSKPPMLVLLESLSFYRNVQIGLIVGVGLATLLYLVRTLELLGPVTEVREYPLFGPDVWFLMLAGVLAVTVALLVATALTIGVAIRTGRQLPRDPNE